MRCIQLTFTFAGLQNLCMVEEVSVPFHRYMSQSVPLHFEVFPSERVMKGGGGGGF